MLIPRLTLQGWSESSVANATLGSAYTVAWLILLAHELFGAERSELPADTH
jgi:hypothetical protein